MTIRSAENGFFFITTATSLIETGTSIVHLTQAILNEEGLGSIAYETAGTVIALTQLVSSVAFLVFSYKWPQTTSSAQDEQLPDSLAKKFYYVMVATGATQAVASIMHTIDAVKAKDTLDIVHGSSEIATSCFEAIGSWYYLYFHGQWGDHRSRPTVTSRNIELPSVEVKLDEIPLSTYEDLDSTKTDSDTEYQIPLNDLSLGSSVGK